MNLLHNMVWLSALVALTTAATLSKFHFVEEWNLWKSQHQKYYNTEEDELTRHTIWLSNKKFIDTHNANADKFGFTLAMNRLGDITDQEYRDLHCCYKEGNFTGRVDHVVFQPPQINLPNSVDWRTKNAVTPVKNQGSCSACYAFSATGALEGAHALAHDSLVSISEQNILDCSVPYGNHGCNGGNTYDVFQYVIDNGGLDTESSYPYKGRQSQCRFDKNSIGATEAGIVTITSGSESDLTAATATAGPVAVAVDGSSNAFRFYASGIFDEPNCSSSRPTHSMLIIGYGTDGGKDYWTVKNSWGTSWGMSGYIKMTRNQSNQCGIATAASFPTL